MNEQIAAFHKKMGEEFASITRTFFEETGLEAVAWSQYTPYFNDGEECTFSIDEVYFIRNGYAEHGLPSRLWELEEYTYGDKEDHKTEYDVVDIFRSSVDPLGPICQDFKNIIHANEDLFLELFGDHTTVVLTPGETELVENTSHD